MQHLVRKVRRDEEGFTIIELVIVIVILGILAAVVVFAVSGINDRGQTAACKADVKAIDTAAESYYAQKGTAAATMTDLVNNGFLHKDSQIQSGGLTKVTASYTITFTPGTGVAPNFAGNADTVGAGSGGGAAPANCP